MDQGIEAVDSVCLCSGVVDSIRSGKRGERRAVDYRYRFTDSFAVGLFAGVARYNLATPAYSIYFGTGAQWRNILPKWDLGVDVRLAQNVARDHVLPSDPQGARPDSFYKIYTGLLYLSRRF